MNNPAPKKAGRGCLFWGAIVAGVMMLIVVGMIYLGYRYVRGVVDQYTDTKPMTLPTVQMSEAEMRDIRDRYDAFIKSVDAGKATNSFTLTSDQVNALIQTETNLAALKGHFYVMLRGDRIEAQLSLPADKFGLKLLSGRYLNATGEFNAFVESGALYVHPTALTVKGKAVPEEFMKQMRTENLAKDWNQNPQTRDALAKVKEIKVQDSKIVIVPAQAEANP